LPFTSMPSLREGNMQSAELTLNEHHTPSGGKSCISDLTPTPAAKSSEEQAWIQKFRELEADKKNLEKKYQREKSKCVSISKRLLDSDEKEAQTYKELEERFGPEVIAQAAEAVGWVKRKWFGNNKLLTLNCLEYKPKTNKHFSQRVLKKARGVCTDLPEDIKWKRVLIPMIKLSLSKKRKTVARRLCSAFGNSTYSI